MQDDAKVEEIDLLHVFDNALRILKHTWFFGVLLAAVFAIAGSFYTWRSFTPSYKAYASFIVKASSSEDSTSSANTTTSANTKTAEQLNETFPYVLTSGALSKIVAADLGYDYLPVGVSAEALGDINIFRITVTGSDPQLCLDALNSLIENYPEVARYILGTTKLELLSESGLPTEPYNSPNYRWAVQKYGLIGLAVYVLYILFRSLTSRLVHSKDMLSRYISVPILGMIPQIGSQNRARKSPIQIANGAVSGQYREAMETLRTRVSAKLKHRKWSSIYVTSSMAGEGKTTMACNLAVLMAQHDHTVVLVDADLRNPSVARTMGLEREKDDPGMNEFLNGRVPLDQILRKTEVENLLVLPGGRAVDRVGDQFSNGRFANLIELLKKRADLVIVDTPPCAMMDDAIMAAECLEGGLLVVRKNYANIDAVVAGTEMMAKTNSPLFACAMNFTDGR